MGTKFVSLIPSIKKKKKKGGRIIWNFKGFQVAKIILKMTSKIRGLLLILKLTTKLQKLKQYDADIKADTPRNTIESLKLTPHLSSPISSVDGVSKHFDKCVKTTQWIRDSLKNQASTSKE